MAVYLTLFCLVIAFATFRAFQEKKRRQERRRRILQNLRTALDT
jgi:hypothetical protein